MSQFMLKESNESVLQTSALKGRINECGKSVLSTIQIKQPKTFLTVHQFFFNTHRASPQYGVQSKGIAMCCRHVSRSSTTSIFSIEVGIVVGKSLWKKQYQKHERQATVSVGVKHNVNVFNNKRVHYDTQMTWNEMWGEIWTLNFLCKNS